MNTLLQGQLSPVSDQSGRESRRLLVDMLSRLERAFGSPRDARNAMSLEELAETEVGRSWRMLSPSWAVVRGQGVHLKSVCYYLW